MTLPIDNGAEVHHLYSPGRSGTVIAVHDTSPTATVMWSDGFSSCSLLSELVPVEQRGAA